MDELKARVASADQERRERLNRRLRAAFLDGAEEDSRRRLGRGLTAEELEVVLGRYRGMFRSQTCRTRTRRVIGQNGARHDLA